MYQKEIYVAAADIIRERRTKAEEDARLRTSEVHAKSERIAAIDRELAGTAFAVFRATCAGEDTAPIRRRNDELRAERGELLKKLGYPEDYTAVRYTCPLCSDTGYVDVAMCSCLHRIYTTEAARASGLGRLIGKQTFANFDLSTYAEGKERSNARFALESARHFAESVVPGESGINLLLAGKTGTGKTHLSTAIAERVIDRGYSVLYDCAQNIISAFEADRFRTGYGQPSEERGAKYLECDLLILDDLGSEFQNSFTEPCLYNLLNTRILAGLPTVVSTNLSPAELSKRYNDRFFSRLCGCGSTVLQLLGGDHRFS